MFVLLFFFFLIKKHVRRQLPSLATLKRFSVFARLTNWHQRHSMLRAHAHNGNHLRFGRRQQHGQRHVAVQVVIGERCSAGCDGEARRRAFAAGCSRREQFHFFGRSDTGGVNAVDGGAQLRQDRLYVHLSLAGRLLLVGAPPSSASIARSSAPASASGLSCSASSERRKASCSLAATWMACASQEAPSALAPRPTEWRLRATCPPSARQTTRPRSPRAPAVRRRPWTAPRAANTRCRRRAARLCTARSGRAWRKSCKSCKRSFTAGERNDGTDTFTSNEAGGLAGAGLRHDVGGAVSTTSSAVLASASSGRVLEHCAAQWRFGWSGANKYTAASVLTSARYGCSDGCARKHSAQTSELGRPGPKRDAASLRHVRS